jgi:ATP-dependent Lon protease
MEDRLKEWFSDMLVYKNPDYGKFFSALSLPSFMRDWLLMRFSDSDGRINKEEVSEYVRKTIPQKNQWPQLLYQMLHEYQTVKFLAKIKIEFDTSTRTALFSLPDFGVPRKKGEAIVEWNVIEDNQNYLLAPNEIWGIIEMECIEDDLIKGDGNVLKLKGFKPFSPYTIDLDYYCEARKAFSIDEWIDILLSAIDYNPKGYVNITQKMTMLSRLLPFVEKRVNLIELAPKGTGKSYLFSQISKFGWLVSGGSISRAKMFYDISKRSLGLVSYYDYVAFDEIQSIKFTDASEMQGALKGFLESPTGEYRIGDYRGIGESGLILLGNIDVDRMNIYTNMFIDLPEVFHESALIDRFHGFIKGWDIPRMQESLKVNGWALNVEYFSEIMHLLRSEVIYRGIVDEMLAYPKNADTRDTEAIKRMCTGFLKLLFPNVRKTEEINNDEFVNYCLKPSIEMRRVIKTQLGIIDSEFAGKDVPEIHLVEK